VVTLSSRPSCSFTPRTPRVRWSGHRRQGRPAGVPGYPPPHPCPGRGPDPHRQAGRARPAHIPRVRHQRGVAVARVDCRDPIAWTQTIHPPRRRLVKAEPKLLRYRPLHTAARMIHCGRNASIKIALPAGPGPTISDRVHPPRQHPATAAGLTANPVPTAQHGPMASRIGRPKPHAAR
jgi:hypothetical protein